MYQNVHFSRLHLRDSRGECFLGLGQVISEFLEGGLGKLGVWPEVGREVDVGTRYGLKGCLGYKR